MIHIITWINLKDIVLSEISQPQSKRERGNEKGRERRKEAAGNGGVKGAGGKL